MSFSSEIKSEILANVSKIKNELYIKAERLGENLVEATRKSDLTEQFSEFLNMSHLEEECIQAILKGAFLGSGYIADPYLDYRFEIVLKNKACAEYLFNLLSLLEFTPKLMKRKNTNSYVVYMNESDQIATILSLLQAGKALLHFESIRVEKDVKNTINRTTNCEIANLSKTIQSSIKQVKAIEKIKKCGAFDSLNEKLKETAELRMQYQNESLDYLSKQTIGNQYISKSGLKHRLDKIVSIAEQL